MSLKSKILIVILAGVGVIAILCAVFAAVNDTSVKTYTGCITEGQRYLEIGDYDKAIEAFETALSLDDTSEEAYEGIVTAYIARGDMQTARRWLLMGIEATDSQVLAQMLEADFSGFEETTLAAEDENIKSGVSVNNVLLDFVANASFSDYSGNYSVEKGSQNNGEYTYTVDELGCVLVYDNTGTVNRINKSTCMPYPESVPDRVDIQSASSVFGSREAVDYDTLKALPGISDVTKGDGFILFYYGKLCITAETDTDGSIAPDCSVSVVIPEQTEEETETQTEENKISVKGIIKNATDGAVVSGAKVTITQTSTGSSSVSLVTNADGAFTAMLAQDKDFHIVIEKEGFITEENDFHTPAGAAAYDLNYTISPVMSAGEIRIVLTWNSTPQDLDSHLEGMTGSGTAVRVDYTRKISLDRNGNTEALLDVDDTDGYGPETVTITDTSGSYNYYVVDYTQSGTMSDMGAQVKVYADNNLVYTVDICQGCNATNRWSVLNINQGNIELVNTPG